MEVTREWCEACGARDLQNLLVRATGEVPVVLVRCARCGELVARYGLASYFHRGERFTPWLADLRIPTESAIDLADAVETAGERAAEELTEALAALGSDDHQ